MEKEKMNLRLDVDVQKFEADKLRKGKNKAEEELDSLKTNYKKLRLSMRTAGLGKILEQWREEIREERNKSDWWERKFQEVQTQNEALEKSLSESQKENGKQKDKVVELKRSLRQHRSRNSVVELKTSLSKIEEMKNRIEELKTTLRNCEVQIEHLRAKKSHQKEQLHYFQNHVRNRDHIIGKTMVQIQEVVDHLQTLAVQADTLSVKYELESDRGQKFASLLKKIKALSIMTKPYL
ncbi:restin homolog [Gossypium hirsutum]|uniref:Restin homolog n=1 Tax=Gossypium hirsutum TaxID=3635 RepID=A0ABM2ZXH0_GOSHI|nr:restin homolog [Gossypium hirsutum]